MLNCFSKNKRTIILIYFLMHVIHHLFNHIVSLFLYVFFTIFEITLSIKQAILWSIAIKSEFYTPFQTEHCFNTEMKHEHRIDNTFSGFYL